ncbi:MAG: hypothetical protein ACOX89_04250 [Lutispora sp.]|jgi:hypothetical protein
MNYIKEINAFRNYLKTNPLDATTQALWYVIIDYHNSEGWQKWITIENSRLIAELGISEKTLIKHRNKLIQAGLIDYKSQQRKKSSGRYCLFSFEQGEAGRNKNTSQTAGKITAECSADWKADCTADWKADPSDIYKQKETKQKERKKGSEQDSTYQKIIDDYTQDENLKEAIWGYIQMRISKKAKPTDRALKLVLKNLSLMSGGDLQMKIDILNQSIMNNWTGIFPLREIKGVHEHAATKDNRGESSKYSSLDKSKWFEG